MDDAQFESYLKTFRPIPPAPLPTSYSRSTFILLAAAAALFIGLFLFQPKTTQTTATQLFTIGAANAALINAPSWKSAINDAGFAFPSATATKPPSTQSAIEFLSQEHLPQ
jgi:hypothetical protein